MTNAVANIESGRMRTSYTTRPHLLLLHTEDLRWKLEKSHKTPIMHNFSHTQVQHTNASTSDSSTDALQLLRLSFSQSLPATFCTDLREQIC
eukprot:1893599-Amphidinium_carterae.1